MAQLAEYRRRQAQRSVELEAHDVDEEKGFVAEETKADYEDGEEENIEQAKLQMK